MKTKSAELRKCKKCGEPKTIGAFRVGGDGRHDKTCGACRNSVQKEKVRAQSAAGKTGPEVISNEDSVDYLRLALKNAQAELRRDRTDILSAEMIRREVYGLAAHSPAPPTWLQQPERGADGVRGCPVTLWSDWHYGEVVKPEEVGGLNSFNASIAEERVKRLVSKTIDLAFNHMGAAKASYPGAVVGLGGDMISGDIHEELTITNDRTPMQAINDLTDILIAALTQMRDAFGRLFVPCVVGNHGRSSRKPRMKGRVTTSFEYNIYCNLERHFRNDDRVRIFVAPETDVHFNVYGTRVILTHGDSLGVKGGDGIIGAIGPIMRGTLKLGRSEAQIGRDADLILMGHWHQELWLPGVFVNNCFPAGTRVSTPAGPTPIETLKVGDVVLSRDGTTQTVNHQFTRTSDEGLVSLKVKGLPNVLSPTPNHHIWAMKANSVVADVPPSRRHLIDVLTGKLGWISSEHLSPGDYVHVPVPKGTERPVDVETAWAYGLYIAEGNAILDGGASKKHHRIHLSMHLRERDIVERWAAWFESTFGKTPCIYSRPATTGTALHVSAGRDTSVWFREMFGHTSHFKHAPNGALCWADDLKAALVDGWITGDGHSATNDDCRPTVSATTVSERLAWEMFYLAFATGRYPALSKLAAGGPRKSDAFTVHLNVGQDARQIDGEIFYPIAERFQSAAAVPVYDLEVSGNHTYCAEGVGVSNSLKGYDEFARLALRAPFSLPSQMLFFVHPRWGVTARWGVLLEEPTATGDRPWVSWPEVA